MAKRSSKQKDKLKKLIYQLKLMRKYSWMTFIAISFVVVAIGMGGPYLSWYFFGQVDSDTAIGDEVTTLPQTGEELSVTVESKVGITINTSNCNNNVAKYYLVQELKSESGQKLLQSKNSVLSTAYGLKQQVNTSFEKVDALIVGDDLTVVYKFTAVDKLGNISNVIANFSQQIDIANPTVEFSKNLTCFSGTF